jgi:hypothetical protein
VFVILLTKWNVLWYKAEKKHDFSDFLYPHPQVLNCDSFITSRYILKWNLVLTTSCVGVWLSISLFVPIGVLNTTDCKAMYSRAFSIWFDALICFTLSLLYMLAVRFIGSWLTVLHCAVMSVTKLKFDN